MRCSPARVPLLARTRTCLLALGAAIMARGANGRTGLGGTLATGGCGGSRTRTKLWRAPSAAEVDLKRCQSVLVHMPVRGNAKLYEGIAQSVAASKCQDGLNPAFAGPLRRDPSDRCDASVALERRLSTRAACRREIHPRDARGYAWFFQALRWRCRVRCDRCHLLVWDSTQVTAAGAITRSPCKAPPCPPTCILKTPTSMACRAHPSPATGSATLDRNDVSVYSQH